MSAIVPLRACAILHGECRQVLSSLPEESVHCVVTSPPYWSLRDYSLPAVEWADGWVGCLGLEPDPEQFVAHMVEVFREIRRVLRKDGVCWMNMGDSYNTASSSNINHGFNERWGNSPGARKHEIKSQGIQRTISPALKPKDLVGQPWRVALALQADGWWLRCDCIWSKSNPLPESVRDRPTRSHEYVFLLTKSERYFYDAEAVREPYSEKTMPQVGADYGGQAQKDYAGSGAQNPSDTKRRIIEGLERNGGRNLRSVWHLPTQPFPQAHFATYPERLVEPCIKAGTSEKGCCPECGAPWRRIGDRKFVASDDVCEEKCVRGALSQKPIYGGKLDGKPRGRCAVSTKGWEPTCSHGHEDTEPCVVLDPFGGSGTTGVVAARLGRRAIIIDQSREYLGFAHQRLLEEETSLGFFE